METTIVLILLMNEEFSLRIPDPAWEFCSLEVMKKSVTFSIYFFLNFQKLIIKIFAIIIILFSFTQFIDNSFSDKLFRLGKTERLITNDNTSTNIRIQFIERSVELATCYPFGVGIGNWKLYSIKCEAKNMYSYVVPFFAHNDFLEILAEIGIIGSVFFILSI